MERRAFLVFKPLALTYIAPMLSTELPKGPRGMPLLGTLPRAFRDGLKFWIEMNQSYGPVAYAKLAWFDLYMLNEPELVTKLFVEHHRDAVKDMSQLPELLQFWGMGLVSLDGEPWRVRRKLAAPSLQPKRMSSYVDSMVSAAERACGAYVEGERRDFHEDSMRITLEIAAKTLLGFDVGPEAERIAEIMHTALAYFTKRMFRLSQRFIPPSVPTADQRAFRRAVRDLDAIIYNMLADLRMRGSDEQHLLAQLMRARDENGRGLSDQELRDEAVTMLVSGHETAALTLTFAVYELARQPAVAARLREEVERVAPGGRSLRAEDLPQLTWAEAIAKETLRLYPPGHALTRRVVQPFELGGYTMPKGALVGVSPYAMQRNPRFYPDPERFHPQRWFEGAEKAPRGCYMPFGDGPRVCVGSHFALAEVKLVLSTLLRQLDFELGPNYELKLDPGITLRPIGGMPVIVHRRQRHHESLHLNP